MLKGSCHGYQVNSFKQQLLSEAGAALLSLSPWVQLVNQHPGGSESVQGPQAFHCTSILATAPAVCFVLVQKQNFLPALVAGDKNYIWNL